MAVVAGAGFRLMCEAAVRDWACLSMIVRVRGLGFTQQRLVLVRLTYLFDDGDRHPQESRKGDDMNW